MAEALHCVYRQSTRGGLTNSRLDRPQTLVDPGLRERLPPLTPPSSRKITTSFGQPNDRCKVPSQHAVLHQIVNRIASSFMVSAARQKALVQQSGFGLVSPCADASFMCCVLGPYLAPLAPTISTDDHSCLERSPAATEPFAEMVCLGEPCTFGDRACWECFRTLSMASLSTLAYDAIIHLLRTAE